jgi:putative Mn2+ efflux pump MntP
MDWIIVYIIPFLLSTDAFFLSISGGVTMMPFNWQKALKIALVYELVISISAVLAFLLSQLVKPLITGFSFLVGNVFILFTAVRFINDARKIKNEERTFLLEDNKILLTSSIAASFIIFLAFFGLGLILIDFQKSIFVLGISIFLLSFLGIFIGNHYKPIRLGRSSKFASGILILILITINYLIHF